MQHQSSFAVTKTLTLALIDDDPVVEIILKRQSLRLPKEQQPEVMTFTNGPHALEYFQFLILEGKRLPDLVFLDLNMPKLNGWEVLEELEKIPQDQRPITYIISSSIDPEDKERAAKHPFVSGFLSKPIFQETLFEVFRKVD